MKKMIFLFLMATVSLQAALTTPQLKKLQNSLTNTKGDFIEISKYNSINFDKKVIFDNHNLEHVIVKSYAIMKQGIISKENFVSISSSMSDQILQSIFMNSQFRSSISSIDLLVNTPDKVDLTIQMEFKKSGIETIITNGVIEEKKFTPYDEMFHFQKKR
jgi:hypothetical protein